MLSSLGEYRFLGQSNLEPMVVDVILVQRSVGWDPVNFSPQRNFIKTPTLKEQVPNFLNLEPEEFGVEPRNEKVIERWVVQYESRKSRDGVGCKKSGGNLHSLCKKAIVLLRSLYVTIRLLPAYKLFRTSSHLAHLHIVFLRLLSLSQGEKRLICSDIVLLLLRLLVVDFVFQYHIGRYLLM